MLQSRLFTSEFLGQVPARETSVHRQSVAEGPGLQMIERLFHPCVIVLQDKYMNVSYMSENSVHLFGYGADHLKNTVFRTPANYLPVEDKELFLRTRQKIDEFSRTIRQHEIQEHRFVMNYRFRKGDGKYIHLREERISMADPTGINTYFLLFKDISAEKPFMRVHLQWLKYQNGTYTKINSYVPAVEESNFSQREIEVLQLIKEGFSSKEIADTLSISINTVRNHRSNLFKKSQARNMVELLNYADSIVYKTQ